MGVFKRVKCYHIMNRLDIIQGHISVSYMNKTIGIIGIPHSVAQPIVGCEYGASLMRDRGLIPQLNKVSNVIDMGDVRVIMDDHTQQCVSNTGRLLKNAWSVGQTSLNILKRSKDVRNNGHIPLVIGGDHSIAIGSVASALVKDPNVGILWIDAHADINTPDSSLTMNMHGMPLSLLMKHVDPMTINGFKWMYNVPVLKPNRLVYIGLRDIDIYEKQIIKKLGITAYTMNQVSSYGIERVMEMAMVKLLKHSTTLHVSWDIDAIDPLVAPSTGTRVTCGLSAGGLSEKESMYIAKSIALSGSLISMDMVEINPLLGNSMDDSHRTVDIANRIICTMFG
jgi:arginase